jgi:outer membrane protein OmpA-like peptidoglycan-associated protein
MKTLQNLYNLYLPKLRYTIALPLLILLAACGGPPANNPLLTNATEEYNIAEQDTMVVKYAPVALKEAEESLEITRKLWAAKADKSAVDHYAYIAQKKTVIAVETASFNAATSEISQSEVERQQVLLDVRQSEADRSEARAESALSEAKSERALAVEARDNAEESRQTAMDAEERAKLLAQRVNELEARPTDRGLVLTLGDVLFEFGKSTMRSEGMKNMDDLASFLVEYPERNIMIEGFTDNIGSEAFNMELSRNRAISVQSALVNRNITASRINIIGYGFQFPVANNASESGRQQNRRVEIIISDQEGNITARGQ